MPSALALALWFILLLGLLYFDPAKEPGTPFALWVPVIWMFIIGSRLPSQWLGGGMGSAAQAFEEGNPLDRAIFSLLILLAIVALVSRSFNWGSFFSRNSLLTAFLLYALISCIWSDFTLVAFKRWFRDLGNYLVILVVLSDPRPQEAVATVLRRLSYLMVPLSVVLIKYFPGIGTGYSEWTGAAAYIGATTSKNLLGVVCLVSGIFFFWDTLTRWPNRRDRRTKRILAVNFVFIGMILWLMNLANSATSRVCLLMGCLVILAVHTSWSRRHPGFVKALMPACFCFYLILAFGFDLNGELASQVGRDPTLTDRTLIWQTVLDVHTNPVLGTGYESFWLGPRLEWIWKRAGHINESHNGYLEIYLNLGLVGLALLVGLLISSYRAICKGLAPLTGLASFNLALWTTMLFYNMTEAAFKYHPMWLAFLLGAIAVPARSLRGAQSAPTLEPAGVARIPSLAMDTTSLRRS